MKVQNLISSKDDSKEQRETEDDAMKELNDYWVELQREGVLDTDTLGELWDRGRRENNNLRAKRGYAPEE